MENVWCTLVMLDDGYAKGAAVVAQTLRDAGTRYPIWCMVGEGISDTAEDFLRGIFDKIIHVPLISHKCIRMRSRKQNEIYGSWIEKSFTKWNILRRDLFPVDKVILVDADMMFLRNCDELFELAAPALTFSNAWAKPYVPHTGASNPHGELPHGTVVNPRNITKGFNGSFVGMGCMVLANPDDSAYTAMINLLSRDTAYGHRGCISGFDEQLITETFLYMNIPITHIHQKYNWIVGKTGWLRGEIPHTMQFYNSKPWLEDPVTTQWDDVKDWYCVYDRVRDRGGKK